MKNFFFRPTLSIFDSICISTGAILLSQGNYLSGFIVFFLGAAISAFVDLSKKNSDCS
jgi:hypothetical protein